MSESDFYNYECEDLMLAAAAASPEWARSPDFSPNLLTGERAKLAKIITNLAVRGQEIFRDNVSLMAGGDDKVMLAWDQMAKIENPPHGKAIIPVIDELRTLCMRRTVADRTRKLHGESSELDGAEILNRVNNIAIDAQRVMDSAAADDMEDGSDMSDVIEDLRRRIEEPNKLTGMEFEMPRLQKALDGLCGGRLILVAGRPHVGKTTVAITLISGLLYNEHRPAIFSLEMTAKQLKQALLDIKSGVTIPPGVVPTKDELMRIKRATEEISGYNWWIDDSDRLPIDRICAKARIAKHRHDIDSVFVDYAQIVSGSDQKTEPRLILNEVTGKLKGLAKELNIPVTLMSQINRGITRTSPETGRTIYGRPAMSDMKESSSLESDADAVILIHRELENEDDSDTWVDMDLILAKNRITGLRGDIPCKFNRRTREIDEQSHMVRFC